ncbi:MAG: ATP-binding cassette domain-containing protein [Thaumarchaeota archaeon]|nr:ATP-binding cassette domain-containing protein [Nitrososphaerota archaeon]
MLDVRVSIIRGSFSLLAEIREEGFICLSGPNGSGKSSLLNVIAGNLRADHGYVKVNDADITNSPIERRGVVLVNQDSLIPHLDVEKHLRWGARVRRVDLDEAYVEGAKERLGIAYSGRVDKLSLGMRERVVLATALLSNPQVILVDEAFSNIDNQDVFVPAFREMCIAQKVDSVHTTQDKADARVSDHHYEIVGGQVSKVF